MRVGSDPDTARGAVNGGIRDALSFEEDDANEKKIRHIREFQRLDSMFGLIFVIIVLGIIIIPLRLQCSNLTRILAVTSAAISIVSLSTIFVYILKERLGKRRLMTVQSEAREKGAVGDSNGLVRLLHKLSVPWFVNDIALVSAAIAATLHLLQINQCNSSPSATITGSKDTSAALLLSVMVVPVIQRVLIRTSRVSLLLSWAIVISLVNAALVISNSSSSLEINLEMILAICFSYGTERSRRHQEEKSVLIRNEAMKNAALMQQHSMSSKALKDNERALHAKRATVRYISHELRSMLNSVAIGIDILESELAEQLSSMPYAIQELLVAMKDSSSSALETINDLLMFEKITAGMTKLECVPVSIATFLHDTTRQYLIQARAKEIGMTVSIPREANEILTKIDPVKMSIVFRNLLTNAIKFTPVGGKITVKVTVVIDETPRHLETRPRQDEQEDPQSVTRRRQDIQAVSKRSAQTTMDAHVMSRVSTPIPSSRKRRIIISVKDSGAGLAPEHVKQLFQEGVQFRANELQGGGGSGFGLFITKSIVDLHDDARIWAESDGEGKGSTFKVELPVIDEATGASMNTFHIIKETERKLELLSSMIVEEEQNKKESSSMSSKLAAQHNSLCILVVDDSPANRKMHVRLLERMGHTCITADDGVAALSHIIRMMMRRGDSDATYRRIDAVLTDDNMPRMNGTDAATEMRNLGYAGPIIVATGGDDKDSSIFREAGVTMVLLKPINIEALATALKDAFKITRHPPSKDDSASRSLDQLVMRVKSRSLLAPQIELSSEKSHSSRPSVSPAVSGRSDRHNSGSNKYVEMADHLIAGGRLLSSESQDQEHPAGAQEHEDNVRSPAPTSDNE